MGASKVNCFYQFSFPVIVIACILVLNPMSKASAGFIFSPINTPILSASFSADFAVLVAHRTVAGFEVNMVRLIDPSHELPDLDLSDSFFGTAEFVSGEPPAINQSQLETGIFSAPISSSFFSVLQTGRVGLSFLATDTDDGLFAIDFLRLSIQTVGGDTVDSFIDTNDGFGIDLPDGSTLPAPLPVSISIGATGIGFDEAISSKGHFNVPLIPEPTSISLLIIGLLYLFGLLHRRTEV